MARKFLYVIAALTVLVIAGAFAYRLYGNDLIRMALVPGSRFRDLPAVEVAAYRDPAMWIARPDLPGNPARWTPPGYAARTTSGGPAVFFIHPTSYITRDAWNAPVHPDAETAFRTDLFVRGQASAFNEVGEVWAPRYRQATFGAFLTRAPDAEQALGLAYRDVRASFEAFLQKVAPGRPLILAAHSQGALHLSRLLRDRIAPDRRLRRRIVAAYVVGWPISEAEDLPRMGLPQCTAATQTGCVLSWASFAEPADPTLIEEAFDASVGFTGRPRRATPIVCTNPISGTADGTAPASANLGTIFQSPDLKSATIQPGRVPARCAGRGYLLIGEGPDMGGYVLPGNNYHVFDYSLFWANVRADAARRVAAFR
jgi:hypothetical protein